MPWAAEVTIRCDLVHAFPVVPTLALAGQWLTGLLLFLHIVSSNSREGQGQLAQRTGTGFIMRAVCRMYMGALRRMNIIRVGCMALRAVGLNMAAGGARCRVESPGCVCGRRVAKVCVSSNVTSFEVHGKEAQGAAEPLADKAPIEPLLTGDLTSPSSPLCPQPLPSTRTPEPPHIHRQNVRRGDGDQALQVRHWYAPAGPPTDRAQLICHTAGTPPTENERAPAKLQAACAALCRPAR